jgi:accessory gene regulator protein AgrB
MIEIKEIQLHQIIVVNFVDRSLLVYPIALFQGLPKLYLGQNLASFVYLALHHFEIHHGLKIRVSALKYVTRNTEYLAWL